MYSREEMVIKEGDRQCCRDGDEGGLCKVVQRW